MISCRQPLSRHHELRRPVTTMSQNKTSNQMWGGRFASGPAAIMQEINASIDFDKKLYAEDIAARSPMREMLADQGIISADDQKKIANGLKHDPAEIEGGKFEFSRQARRHPHECRGAAGRADRAGGGRLHTARSRNDQVAVDFRLWVKDELLRVAEALKGLIAAFLERAEEHAATRDAGLHPSAGGAAGDLRPSLHGLCRDVSAATFRACATRSSAWTKARSARQPLPAPASRSTGT